MPLLPLSSFRKRMSNMIGIGPRQQNAGAGSDNRRLAELLSARDILLDVSAPGKIELFEKIGEHMEWVNGLPRDLVIRSLLHREQIGSTALGEGVAIPHARLDKLDNIQLGYLRLKTPIAFDAPDAKPVSDVFVILVPKVATEAHLRILGDASQMFSDPAFREQLRLAANAADAKLLFDTRSRSLR
jgi:PTS system nitrogen regulatory IIA component